jgi:hypothetical protein
MDEQDRLLAAVVEGVPPNGSWMPDSGMKASIRRSMQQELNSPMVLMPPSECPAAAMWCRRMRSAKGLSSSLSSRSIWSITKLTSVGWFT